MSSRHPKRPMNPPAGGLAAFTIMNINNTALLLTATITPQSLDTLVIRDSTLRTRQYVAAFSSVIQHFSSSLGRIIFVENSGADLSPFANIAAACGQSVKIIPLDHRDNPPRLGKGYGEFRMVDAAIQTGCLDGFDTFAKLTGRLMVRNLPRLVGDTPDDVDFAADLLPAAIGDNHRPRIDTRFFIVRTAFYRQWLKGAYLSMDDSRGAWAEYVFFDRLSRASNARAIHLPCQPHWTGQSASTGEQYDRPLERLKQFPRSVRRRLHRLLGTDAYLHENREKSRRAA